MQKARLYLGAAALALGIGAAFGIKASASYGSGNLWFFNKAGQCVLDPSCKSTGSGVACTAIHYTAAGCATIATTTHVVTD